MKKISKTLCLILTAGITSVCLSGGIKTAAGSLSAYAQKPDMPAASISTQNSCIQTDTSYAKTAAVQNTEQKKTKQSPQTLKRMFVCDGRLYIDTMETSSVPRYCGTMDGQIVKTVPADQKPTKELQSNFGKYSFQYGSRKNRIDVLIDDTWHIFAYNENNLNGVSMKVTKNNARSAKLKITNTTNKQIQFGSDYELEKKNKKTGEWRSVPYIIDNAAFHDIAYTAPKDQPVTWSVNWKHFHGSLKPGTYRIIKDFSVFRGTGDFTEYTLMAEFKVTADTD